MIRFVFLDLDDTLLDFKKAEALAFERTAKQFGIAFSDEIGALGRSRGLDIRALHEDIFNAMHRI